MHYTEDELLPLSALQHLLFCERQCALIHIEREWQENLFTAQGRILHERADSGVRESRKDLRIESGVPLRSLRLGLIGKADVVEFHRIMTGDKTLWRPFPVEYKRGRPKKDNWDRVQLCAQAICLEEMLQVEVPEGALFYGKNRRRQEIRIDEELRRETKQAAARLHELVRSGRTPLARYQKKCKSCSLMALCMPKVAGAAKSVNRYLSQVLAE
ncbi:MAG: CRISPR-associated protein Cas4 [Proteobacteria bacterium]|nr:CRISPR-associated protein Cas4 [Pseudomonadota bacterium]